MDYYTDLTVADCEIMNVGTRSAGPEGADLITQGECEDLAEFFAVGSLTVRRWFRVPVEVGGTLPPYRRLVPIASRPGDVLNPYAPGRSIASMYPTADQSPAQRFAIEMLRFRCQLGATVGTEEGLTKDAKFHGGTFTFHNDFLFLSDCLELGVNALIEGHWGFADFGSDDTNHGAFLASSWFKVTIRILSQEERTFGAKWRVQVYATRPHPIFDEGGSD